jgi:hypothetical protein
MPGSPHKADNWMDKLINGQENPDNHPALGKLPQKKRKTGGVQSADFQSNARASMRFDVEYARSKGPRRCRVSENLYELGRRLIGARGL